MNVPSIKNKSMSYKSFAEAFQAHAHEFRERGISIPKQKTNFNPATAVSVTVNIHGAHATIDGVRLLRVTSAGKVRSVTLSAKMAKNYITPAGPGQLTFTGRNAIDTVMTGLRVGR